MPRPSRLRPPLELMSVPDRPPPLIPSHIAWPGFVVVLLLLSITAAAVTVMAARSDGGARSAETVQPVP